MEKSSDSINEMDKFYAERFASLQASSNESILRKIEEDLGADAERDSREKYRDTSNGEYHKTTTLPIPGIDGLDVEIEVDYTIYRGSGARDDTSHVNLTNVAVTEDVHLSEVEVPTSDERKVMGLVHQAVMKIAPNTPQDILLPHGLNVLKLNDALDGLLNEVLSELQDEVYQTQ